MSEPEVTSIMVADLEYLVTPQATEAALRRRFEDWLANMPAEERHANSIRYAGGGWIVIRPIRPRTWWAMKAPKKGG